MTQTEAASHDDELTIPSAARLLGVSRATALSWAYRRILPARQIGRVWVVRRADVEALKSARAAAA